MGRSRLLRAASYYEHLLGLGLSPKTAAEYGRELALALAWFAAHRVLLTAATPSLLVEYASTRPNTPSVRAHLRSALTHYWNWQEVPGWPGAIRVPTPAPPDCKALEPDEIRDIVKVATGWWRPGAAVLVGSYMALRNEEIATMRWDGFDRTGEWYTLVGKKNRQRTVPVHPAVADALDGHQNGSPYVFEGRYGGPITHATIWNWVRLVADQAGVEAVWPHRLRHTALATANDNLGDLRAVQAFAGHVKIETTVRYTRTTQAKLRAVSNSLDY